MSSQDLLQLNCRVGTSVSNFSDDGIIPLCQETMTDSSQGVVAPAICAGGIWAIVAFIISLFLEVPDKKLQVQPSTDKERVLTVPETWPHDE